jgi:hypothetical protein
MVVGPPAVHAAIRPLDFGTSRGHRIGHRTGCEGRALEARIARIESDVTHLREDVGDIKEDVRDLRDKLEALRNRMDEKFDAVNATPRFFIAFE